MSRVLVEDNSGILTISLNRPEKRNAFDAAMIGEITTAFKKAARSKARAVLLKAEGHSFCAGADLEYMKSMAKFSLKQNQADAKKLFEMFESVLICPLPVLARVQGYVMGGGLGLLSACDIAVAESNSTFAFSEVKLGLAPAVISPFVLRKVQRARAHEWMLTGRRFNAEEALAAGLVQSVGSAGEVDVFVTQVTDHWRECGPEGLRATKSLLSSVPNMSWPRVKRKTAQVIAQRRVSQEGQEGLRAFLEGRSPVWKQVK